METDHLQQVQQLSVRQRVRLSVNQYEVIAEDPDGRGGGEVIAFAQQKRVALNSRVTFYTDASKETPFGGFAERDIVTASNVYDVTDADGKPVGSFRKNFKKSLFRSTWHLEQPGIGELTGTERSGRVAVIRRIWQFLPVVDELPLWTYHFDFRLDGQPAFSVTRQRTLRDRYLVDIHDPRLDRRLVIAQAVALDAMQAR